MWWLINKKKVLPAGHYRSLLRDNASDSLLVSGLKAQLQLEWDGAPLEKSCQTRVVAHL